VEREAERKALSRADAYLNYHPTAKWLAYVAAVGTGVLYVGLLALLWLFADLIVHGGKIPAFRDLTAVEQAPFTEAWGDLQQQWDTLSVEERKSHLANLGVDEQTTDDIVAGKAKLPPRDWEGLWRNYVRHVLLTRVGPEAEELITENEADDSLADRGVLSLLVRSAVRERFYTPLIGWVARWNPWMWRTELAGLNSTVYLSGLFVLATLLALAIAFLGFLGREMAAKAVIEATTRLRRAVYHHTFRLGTLAIHEMGPGEAVGVFTRHVEAVHDALYARLTALVREPVKFVLLLIFALCVNLPLALAFLLCTVLLWLLGSQIAAYFRRKGRLATNRASEQLTLIRETLILMRLVKVYLMELFNQSRVERLLSRYGKAQAIRYRGEAIYKPLLFLLGTMAALILLWVGGLIVLNGQLGVGSAITLATALASLYSPLETWLGQRRTLRRGRESAVQLFKFLDRPGEVGQVVGAEFLPPLSKRLEFDNVSVREPSTGRLLLQDVNLTIKSGQRIGLVGSDDLEKHALVYLIPRLLDPTAGEIRIDQYNLRWVTLDSLRAQMGIVLQHNLVFHDTVANNIGCGDPAYTLPQIIEAAKVAHAHHFIQKLPQGYETPIGELGHGLSLSEKFRIGFARAILRDPALLIIEEPEAALDEETKALLDDTFARFLPGRTVLFLPHRISTIRSCDQIYLLNKGRIEATGLHRDLLSQNALYRHLHYLEFNEITEQV
jgi:ATP-binding cassette subfamily B protein